MKLHEYETTPGATRLPARADHREGSAVLTCAACGCRLTPRTALADGGRQGPDAAWRHFPGTLGRDARGCLVECVDQAHRVAWAEGIPA